MWLLIMSIFGLICVFVFSFIYLYRKQAKYNDSVSVQQKISFVRKIAPASHAKGWNLLTVDNGLRVWKKEINSNDSWYSGLVYGCSALVSASLQEILTSIKDLRCITEWDPCVKQVSQVTVSINHDVVSVLPATSAGLVEKSTRKLMDLFGIDTNAICSRHWNANEGWVFTSSMQQTIPSSGLLWCGVIILPVAQDKSEVSQCLVSMVTAPSFPGISTSQIKMLTSARVAGLKDFFVKASVPNDRVVPNGDVLVESSAEKPLEANNTKCSETTDPVSKPIREYKMQEVGEFTHVSMSDTDKKISNDVRVKEILEISMKAYNGKTGADGWSLIGNIKDVEITKRIAQPGEKPFDTLKGVGLVNVPIHYVLAYAFNLEYRGQWDDMFLKGEVVKQLDGLTRIVWMEYKAVWPTTGRDFVNLVALREVNEGLYVVAAAGCDDSNCGPKKGLVRGEILCGGFFVREVSSDPPCCQVTYISRVDLKGNLPPRLVNRVTQSQPQAIAVLREKLETLYNNEKKQATDKEEMSVLQKQGVDLWVELMKMREMKENGQLGSQRQNSNKSPRLYNKILESMESLESRRTADEKSLTDVSIENDQAEERSVEVSGAQINEENMNLPFVDRHQIDYKTLGNQIAATLIGEVLLASKAEISMSEDPGQQSSKEGEWSYQSIERDVVILRKINPGEKIHSFLGKGMIKTSPTNVWNAVKNHMTRHVYDKTLKKTKILKQIDESSKLLYLHHETAQCFVKQARDFVLLAVDRVEPESYVVAGVSVDAPESPPVKDLIRGKVYASGWVIEPVLQDGQLYSMVSYLSQVDFGGVVPVRLINYIARRQPLCISYLREYLEKFKE
ncbi:uncharacterized protein LOC116301097 [Actinia tenebrosa]|uniref:Uncharacterized protein LOC116301097 n=1 Tax=Actinia tenebrosa TaxID=6105 RepID=A0A6P8IGT9_ACTTE|nr:uncharacterized protein LOC116301097 [Actinia tenebrosa]